jgi:hypothetical protein
MSAWKIAIRRLYELDGLATTEQVCGNIPGLANIYEPIKRLRDLGLVEPATGVGRNQVCRITPLGRAFVEGRAELEKRPANFRRGRPHDVIRMLDEAK